MANTKRNVIWGTFWSLPTRFLGLMGIDVFLLAISSNNCNGIFYTNFFWVIGFTNFVKATFLWAIFSTTRLQSLCGSLGTQERFLIKTIFLLIIFSWKLISKPMCSLFCFSWRKDVGKILLITHLFLKSLFLNAFTRDKNLYKLSTYKNNEWLECKH